MVQPGENRLNKYLSPKLLLALLLAGILGWFGLRQWEKGRTVTYVIPAGTNQQLATGEDTIDFPIELIFTIGIRDTIIIDNQDNVVHTFGPFTILPNTTLTKRFKTARVYENTCTIHKDRQMKLIVNPAPWNILNNSDNH